MDFFACGGRWTLPCSVWVREISLMDSRDARIIRANVNGTEETILYESDVFYVSLFKVILTFSLKVTCGWVLTNIGFQEMKNTYSWQPMFKKFSKPDKTNYRTGDILISQDISSITSPLKPTSLSSQMIQKQW
jgi:hypothetical protein